MLVEWLVALPLQTGGVHTKVSQVNYTSGDEFVVL
jgi:hypothetical protein